MPSLERNGCQKTKLGICTLYYPYYWRIVRVDLMYDPVLGDSKVYFFAILEAKNL